MAGLARFLAIASVGWFFAGALRTPTFGATWAPWLATVFVMMSCIERVLTIFIAAFTVRFSRRRHIHRWLHLLAFKWVIASGVHDHRMGHIFGWNFAFHHPLNVAQTRTFIARAQRYCLPFAASSRGPANTVNIGFRNRWHIIIDHQRDLWDINTTSRNIGRDQNMLLA